MKAGEFFEHPVKNTGKKIKLIAVSSDRCADCIFNTAGCESDEIGKRHRDITGSCSIDKVVYQLHENIEPINE